MSTRKDRNQRATDRETARKERKENRTTEGITAKQLSEAEAELKGEADFRDADKETTFAALLDDYKGAEQTREGLRLQHQRTVELKTHGRKVDPSKIVTQYAQAKQTIQMIEDQMAAFLRTLEEDDVQEMLTNRHIVPDKGYIWDVPDDLVDRMEEALGLSESEVEVKEESTLAEDSDNTHKPEEVAVPT